MKQILFIVGSLRKNSFNLQLAKEAEKILEGKACVRFLNYTDIPFMNQDIEFPAPETVERIRQGIKGADGIWIFTPEYNHSYPGHLKNLLDWLSRPITQGDPNRITAIAGKKVCMSGVAGRSAASDSMDKLTELLRLIRADIMENPRFGVALDGTSFATDCLNLTESQKEGLREQAEAFLAFIS